MRRNQVLLGDEERRLLDEESRRSGRSIGALIRNAVIAVYGQQHDADADISRIDLAIGAWHGREVDGQEYVERLRSGHRPQHGGAPPVER